MQKDLQAYTSIAEAIGLLLFPYAEVVIHDFSTKSVGFLFNNLSKRKIGDPSLLDDMEQQSSQTDVFAPYPKMNWDGRKMKAVSVVLKNSLQIPIGLLCINLDVSKWDQMQQLISEFIRPEKLQPEALFKNDWQEKINVYVTNYLQERGLALQSLTRSEKQKLLLALVKEGAFETKHAAGYIAQVLQISRATVYNYLSSKEKS